MYVVYLLMKCDRTRTARVRFGMQKIGYNVEINIFRQNALHIIAGIQQYNFTVVVFLSVQCRVRLVRYSHTYFYYKVVLLLLFRFKGIGVASAITNEILDVRVNGL